MNYSKTLIKQANTGVCGHIYEHAIVDIINKSLFDDGILKLLDYQLDARAYDGIVVLSFGSNNQDTIDKIKSIAQSSIISKDGIESAIVQVSCEYERLPFFNTTAINDEIQQIHEQKWADYDSFTATSPITELARSMKCSSGHFGHKSPNDFLEHSIIYRIDDCEYDLQPLAIYVIQALALTQINLLYEKIKECYDAGDEWAEYQNLVAYSHNIRIPKSSQLSIEMLRDIEIKNRNIIKSSNFEKKLVDYVLSQSTLDHPYFSNSVMFANSYQVIGKKGWENISTIKNVELLLDKINVTVE